ncbi:MAG: hypothetical protein LBT25_01810 [Candidatus Symbiothrix sp.]|nr:hypothetical protein [Candidatus Symbiothrix sp.]
MSDVFSCKYGFTEPSDNWFTTQIFQYESSVIDQDIINIYPVDERIVFLLGTDDDKVRQQGGTRKDQSALFFRSVDGGRTFEKQVLDKGVLESVSRSADGKSFYMVCARFGEDDERKPSNFQLLKSTDTGKTWTDLYLFEDKLLDKVQFFNDSTGFASVRQEPIGYHLPVLYKTSDGGKTWTPTKVDMDNKSIDLITPEGKLLGRYVEDEPAIWEMDINDMAVKRIPLSIPDGFHIADFIQTDPITKFHYVQLMTRAPNYDMDIEEEYLLLCIETGEIIQLPDNAFHYNIYGDYIGVLGGLKANYNIAQYYYSEDKGKTWKAETPKCFILFAHPGLYGKGYVWVMCSMPVDDIPYPLLVRIPPTEEVQKKPSKWSILD